MPSKLYNKCKKCSYKDNCDNKRMAACGYLSLSQDMSVSPSQSLTMPMAREYTPITINMGEYGTIDTSLEEIKEKLEREINCKIRNSIW